MKSKLKPYRRDNIEYFVGIFFFVAITILLIFT
jgi:hypothetical protein